MSSTNPFSDLPPYSLENPPPSSGESPVSEKPRTLQLGELSDAALEALGAEVQRILRYRAYVRDTLRGWSLAERQGATLQ